MLTRQHYICSGVQASSQLVSEQLLSGVQVTQRLTGFAEGMQPHGIAGWMQPAACRQTREVQVTQRLTGFAKCTEPYRMLGSMQPSQ